jgi:hypothetical protein
MAGPFRKFFSEDEVKLYELDAGNGLELFFENASDERIQEYIDFCRTVKVAPDLVPLNLNDLHQPEPLTNNDDHGLRPEQF